MQLNFYNCSPKKCFTILESYKNEDNNIHKFVKRMLKKNMEHRKLKKQKTKRK